MRQIASYSRSTRSRLDKYSNRMDSTRARLEFLTILNELLDIRLEKLSRLPLEAYVYSHNKANNAKTYLGKVRLTSTSFVPYIDFVVLQYPLEKRTVFSRAKGELGLKVFVIDDPSIESSTPLPATEEAVPNSFPKEKNGKRHTFHHLPNTKQSEQHQKFTTMPPQQQMTYGVHEMKSGPPPSRAVHMFLGSSSQPLDYALKETSLFLEGGRIVGGRVIRGDRPTSTNDLVEQMRFLFVRVVKARDLPSKDVTGSLDLYVEVKVGNYKGIKKHYEKKQNPEWNQVFAFSRDTLQSFVLEVVVKDKDLHEGEDGAYKRGARVVVSEVKNKNNNNGEYRLGELLAEMEKARSVKVECCLRPSLENIMEDEEDDVISS
ncbi:hypothetical protein F3Y22_tig00110163pilonHSYRG00098 [Hibiscus syriacus]|uniref:C2 domain-containing protein n=1 Tax=Hibiscus syriacus TaxID=106335 RepID=A0A6A3BHZ4_HIBSY|nr:hypothetical protein F3Y22_tig00110163pilonHSYRG00098 [Hibiscus syriacus]